MRLHAYVYSDPQKGEYVRATIRVLPGISPARLALLASGELDSAALGQRFADFPLELIEYDRYEPSPIITEQVVLEVLAAQLARLPKEIEGEITLHPGNGCINVGLPLASGRMTVVVAAQPPHRVLCIRLEQGEDKSIDVTNRIILNTQNATIDQLYTDFASTPLGTFISTQLTPPTCETQPAAAGLAHEDARPCVPSANASVASFWSRFVSLYGTRLGRHTADSNSTSDGD